MCLCRPMGGESEQWGGNRWPARGGGGIWQLQPQGATGWWRRVAAAADVLLDAGRGPGLWHQDAGWWPEEFVFHPFRSHGEGAEKFPPRRPALIEGRNGWREYDATLTPEPEKIPVPAGHDMFASGGKPARTVALNDSRRLAAWWNPARRQWKSWGAIAASGGNRLVGTADGVLLIGPEQGCWLLADHSDEPIPVGGAWSHRPVGPPLLHRMGTGHAPVPIWPSVDEDGTLHISLIRLAPGQQKAEPGRYAAAPQHVPVAGWNGSHPAPEFGASVTCHEGYSLWCSDRGFLQLHSVAGDLPTASWHGFADDVQGLPRLGAWMSPTGGIAMLAEVHGHFAMIMDSAPDRPEKIDGLFSLLGRECWRGVSRFDDMKGQGQPLPGDGGGWIHPLAGLRDGAILAARFDNVTEQQPMLLGTTDKKASARLGVVKGQHFTDLQHRFDVANPLALKPFILDHRLAILNAEDGTCISYESA